MKRILVFLLCTTMILALYLPLTVSAEDRSVRPPCLWEKSGNKLQNLSLLYSESIRFLTYAFEGIDHVTYGKTSSLAQSLAESYQLQEILKDAMSKGLTESNGAVSFYDGSDLEYSIGKCIYKMRFDTVKRKPVAIFVLTDTYDFTEIRTGDSISNMLNNLGYELQKNGSIKAYTWMVKVVIPLEGTV